MATYVAVTTTNPQDGWSQIATGTNKHHVRDVAEKKIAGAYWDNDKPIDVQTQLVNLQVVSKTRARQKFGVNIDRVKCQYE